LIVIYIIFIITFRNQGIIKDTGFFKILFLSFGILLYFISNFLITYTNYLGCLLNYIFKHMGISLILYTFYFYISQSYIVDIKKRYQYKLNKNIGENNIFLSSSFIEDVSIPIKSKIENENENENDENRKESLNSKFSNESNESIDIPDKNASIKKNYKQNSLKEIIENISIYYFILFIMIIIYHFNNTNRMKLVFSGKNYWLYKCNMENLDLILNLFDLIILIIIILKGKDVFFCDCFFSILKYIIYSSLICIAIGPIINVSININISFN